MPVAHPTQFQLGGACARYRPSLPLQPEAEPEMPVASTSNIQVCGLAVPELLITSNPSCSLIRAGRRPLAPVSHALSVNLTPAQTERPSRAAEEDVSSFVRRDGVLSKGRVEESGRVRVRRRARRPHAVLTPYSGPSIENGAWPRSSLLVPCSSKQHRRSRYHYVGRERPITTRRRTTH